VPLHDFLLLLGRVDTQGQNSMRILMDKDKWPPRDDAKTYARARPRCGQVGPAGTYGVKTVFSGGELRQFMKEASILCLDCTATDYNKDESTEIGQESSRKWDTDVYAATQLTAVAGPVPIVNGRAGVCGRWPAADLQDEANGLTPTPPLRQGGCVCGSWSIRRLRDPALTPICVSVAGINFAYSPQDIKSSRLPPPPPACRRTSRANR
jgi:hypothetical protein